MEADVIIIGSGQAGNPLADRLGRSGKEVVLIERGRLGGTCVNYGCTPTKTVIASAGAAHTLRRAATLGIRTGEVHVDFEAVMRRKSDMVEQWRSGVQETIDQNARVHLVRGHARFTAPDEVAVDGRRYTAPVVVINTGARAAVPPLPGLDEVEYMDNASILDLQALPSHLLVLGGGYIGCELGQAFRRLGADVTITSRGPHILSREDPEVSETVEDVFREEGIRLALGSSAARVGREGEEIHLELESGEMIHGTHLLVATGRRPNTDDLGCEQAGIERDARGYVQVDDTYRTTAENIYAVGDVTGGPQFTHSAWDDHRILYDILTGRPARSRSGRVIPSSVFTDPQVGRVGLNETEAVESGIDYEAASMPYGRIARAVETGRTAGIMKVLVDPASEEILGATVVGSEGGELVHLFAVLMQAGATARSIVDVQMAHPTFAEGVQSLVMGLDRYRLA